VSVPVGAVSSQSSHPSFLDQQTQTTSALTVERSSIARTNVEPPATSARCIASKNGAFTFTSLPLRFFKRALGGLFALVIAAAFEQRASAVDRTGRLDLPGVSEGSIQLSLAVISHYRARANF
jgi:hypothetical protein